VTQVTSRELETLLQLACFHYLTAAQVEAFLFDGSTLQPASRTRVARRIIAGLVRSGFVQPAQRIIAGGSGPARRGYVLTASGEAGLGLGVADDRHTDVGEGALQATPDLTLRRQVAGVTVSPGENSLAAA